MTKKSKVTKALIAATFLIGIIAMVTPVIAANSNRVFFLAIGDDLDIPRAKNVIIGKIKLSDEPPSASVFFYSKIYDDSGEKYTMMGMLKDGYLINTSYSFFCPLFKVWFINVWLVQGMGKFRTSDTDITVYFRDLFEIPMPNTEGKWVSKPIVMAISHTAEYRNGTMDEPIGPTGIWEQGGWVLAAVVWDYPLPIGPFPIGPISSLAISLGI